MCRGPNLSIRRSRSRAILRPTQLIGGAAVETFTIWSDDMNDPAGATIAATFNTRRQADLALEHLVQELGIDRSDIFLVPEGADNSFGTMRDGADAESGHPGVDRAADPVLVGGITLSVDFADDENLRDIRAALEEHGAEDIAAE
jgi:hypothetical protein